MTTGTLTTSLPLDGLSPSRLWPHLDVSVRTLAARSLYAHDWGDAPTRREADIAIAHALRSREASVRKLPVEKRVEYLARAVRPTDSLASSLLLALHLEHRRPLLAGFLDELGIPHTDGLIRENHDLVRPSAADLTRAARSLFETHAPDEVETYLATLLAMDPEVWGEAAAVLRARGSP